MADRKPLYADLLKVTRKTMSYALSAADALDEGFQPRSLERLTRASALTSQIRHFVSLVSQVVGQTERRVFKGESVPSREKLVSIFETHTDVIVKDRRETLYGHKIALTTGRSGLVLVQYLYPTRSSLIDSKFAFEAKAPSNLTCLGARA